MITFYTEICKHVYLRVFIDADEDKRVRIAYTVSVSEAAMSEADIPASSTFARVMSVCQA